MNTQQETIERAKTDFARAKNQLLTALSSTPDDRINWSPSATARTPLQQVAHAAWAIASIHEMLNGRTFQASSTAEADKSFRAWEEQFTARESVLELLEANSAAYEQFLEALTPEALNATIELPLGSGRACLAEALTFAPNHTKWHTAQIEYIQTIYGDRIWR